MQRSFVYCTVRESARRVIYAVRVLDELLELSEIVEVAAKMRDKIEARGEFAAEVVVVQGEGKETLRLFGTPYSVGLVRTAMFNAAVSWSPIEFD